MRLSQFVRTQVGRGSYMPALMDVVMRTKGPIFELGTGYVSTPYLHWASFESKRLVVSFENDPGWHAFAARFSSPTHRVVLVKNWDEVDLSGECSVALVDHSPEDRRRIDIPRLYHAEYVVVHDTENHNEPKYRMHDAIRRYKYRYKYNLSWPHTSVLSNHHDLSGFR